MCENRQMFHGKILHKNIHIKTCSAYNMKKSSTTRSGMCSIRGARYFFYIWKYGEHFAIHFSILWLLDGKLAFLELYTMHEKITKIFYEHESGN